MFSRFINYWLNIRESLWLVPALICLLYVGGILGALWLERHQLHLEAWTLLYKGDVAPAREFISTLLSAMITMTTLVVSITVVVLSLASSHLGPRLIRNFMSDRRTQVYIGVFFGSVTACFLLTSILHDTSLATPMPRLTVSMVIIACFADLFILLGFVNHIARSCVPDEAIERVSADFFKSIGRILHDDAESNFAAQDSRPFPDDFTQKLRPVFASRRGYVQDVDYKQLVSLGEKAGAFIRLEIRAGDYILPGERVAAVYPEWHVTPELEKQLLGALVLGGRRTAAQDIKYSMRHLVEIALRSLSSGINDSFSAIAAIDRLCAAMACLFQGSLPQFNFADASGQLRVTSRGLTEAEILRDIFSPIRHSARDNPTVLRHLQMKLNVLLSLSTRDRQREGLRRELELVAENLKPFPTEAGNR